LRWPRAGSCSAREWSRLRRPRVLDPWSAQPSTQGLGELLSHAWRTVLGTGPHPRRLAADQRAGRAGETSTPSGKLRPRCHVLPLARHATLPR
jgi:hypothetical protein